MRAGHDRYIAGRMAATQDCPVTVPVAELLQEADRLHGRGALAEASSRYRQVLQREPGHARALYHLAVIACQQGHFQDGIEQARRSLASDPDQPRAHNLLGMALSRLGRHQDALASFDLAIQQQSGFADAHGNRASALMDLGRTVEAVASYERALALAPDSSGDWLNLGTALHQLGRHEQAIASYERALALDGSLAPAHLNRARVLAQLARYEDALAGYDRALTIDRRNPDALHERGQVLLGLGRIEGAVANFEDALVLAPSHPAALARPVELLLAHGYGPRALPAVMRALAANETREGRELFVRCVKNRRFTSDPGGLRELLVRALTEPWDRPVDLAPPAASLVKLNPAVRDACAQAARIWPRRLELDHLSGRLTAIVDDRLLRVLLETTQVCDIELERCLTGMRAILLEAATEAPATLAEDGLLQFCCALARQCFINEYVFDVTSEELKLAGQFRDRIVRAIGSGRDVPVLWLVAAAACLPLSSIPGVEALLERSWSPAVAALLHQQVAEPRAERRLRETIPRLTAIDDELSLAVQRQYEENPYPRWVRPAPAGEPRTLGASVRRSGAGRRERARGHRCPGRRLRQRREFDRNRAAIQRSTSARRRSEPGEPVLCQAAGAGHRR